MVDERLFWAPLAHHRVKVTIEQITVHRRPLTFTCLNTDSHPVLVACALAGRETAVIPRRRLGAQRARHFDDQGRDVDRAGRVDLDHRADTEWILELAEGSDGRVRATWTGWWSGGAPRCA